MRADRGRSRDARKASGRSIFDEAQRFVATPVYDHYALPHGVRNQGRRPSSSSAESTVVVGPRARAHVDAQFNLIMLID